MTFFLIVAAIERASPERQSLGMWGSMLGPKSRSDCPGKEFEQQIEIGVALASGLSVKAPCDLAEGKAETWISGLSPAALRDYLSTRGFCLVNDLSTREAGERYFTPLRRPEQGSDLYHVATATIS